MRNWTIAITITALLVSCIGFAVHSFGISIYVVTSMLIATHIGIATATLKDVVDDYFKSQTK